MKSAPNDNNLQYNINMSMQYQNKQYFTSLSIEKKTNETEIDVNIENVDDDDDDDVDDVDVP